MARKRKRISRKSSPRGKVSPIPAYRRQRRTSGRDSAFVELNGTRQYLGPYGSSESREMYHRVIAEWLANGQQPMVAPEEITVVELASRYLDWARSYYQKNGHLTAEPGNIALAIRPLRKLYGSTPAAELGPKRLRTVREEMVSRGWTRKYINKHVERIKRMFKWAVAEELIPADRYEGLRALPGLRYGRCSAPDNPPVSLAPEELIHPVKRYLSRQVAAMVDLQLLTGARPGEITILRPCDVDRSGPVWLFEPYEHKTEHHGHKRVVFLGPKAQQILMPFLLRDHEDYCFSPIEAEEERYDQLERDCYPAGRPNQKRRPNALRRTKRKLGDHYTRDSYRRAITRAQEQAFPLPAPLAKQLRMDGRLENQKEWNARLTDEQKEQVKAWRKKHHWHPHQLRHNYATRVRSQYGLEAAQILLGHAKADVTQVYAERDIAHATNVAARIG